MQIVEVKNDIAQILYSPINSRLLPSDFILIDDYTNKLIAQVLNTQTTDEKDKNIATARIALSVDSEDNLSYYNGYVPSKDAQINFINPDEIAELIKGAGDNIFFGSLVNHPETFVKTSISFLDNNLAIVSDKADNTNIIVKNIVSEAALKNKKSVIIDFSGRYSDLKNALVVKVSKNVKLPLNSDALDAIYENDLKEAPLEDKVLIQSIFLDLKDYINTLEDKFLPFNLFENVINSQYEQNPLSGLMVLKNQLRLYGQKSVFANSKQDFDFLNNALEENNTIVVDTSEISESLSGFTALTVISLLPKNCYVFLNLNEINFDKKTINLVYNSPIKPIVVYGSEYQYQNTVSSNVKNKIFCKISKKVDGTFYSSQVNNLNFNDLIKTHDNININQGESKEENINNTNNIIINKNELYGNNKD